MATALIGVTLPEIPTQERPARWHWLSAARRYDAKLVHAYTLAVGRPPRELYPPGTLGHAQWTYKPKGRKKADRQLHIEALTRAPRAIEQAA